MKHFTGAVVALFLLTIGCTFSERSVERQPGRFLEKNYAEYRASLISEVEYDFNFDVTKAENFSGTARIKFQMKKPANLSVDFFDGTVHKVTINNTPLSTVAYNKFYIDLPADAFQAGENNLEIQFQQNYGKTGTGLYRFVDPEDQRVYLYTDFEPYDANAMFPCFDQPDLKATYASEVLAPKDWTMISSNREIKTADQGESKVWFFPRTKKFSTYIYSLHGGPYKIWENKAVTKTQTVPLRVMARQSLAKYVDPQEWFTTTQQGFVFFEDFFGYPYPYEKYDEVLVPDFNSGAMENVGAVTFNESRYVSRSKKQRVQRRTQAEVQLHELAHMWFGNLVTMKWWNDIWLNESFATYASYRALMGNTPYQESWTDFMVDGKRSAYWQDQLVTTHPVTFEVPRTDVVFANFDGITYGKGASTLKQLAFYIGDDHFKTGLQNYFKKYAFGNTTLNDFIAELEQASGKPLRDWQNAWLETSQVNTVRADYKCEQGKITGFKVVQTAPKDHPTLRPHKTRLGIFRALDGKINFEKAVDVSYSLASMPVPELNGLACGKGLLIYPNYDDQDYVKVELDEVSLLTAKELLSSVQDEMTRTGLWMSLWEMVVAEKLTGLDYLEVAFKHLSTEPSLDVLRFNLANVASVVSGYAPRASEWKDRRDELVRTTTDYFLANAKKAAGEDSQKMWFDAYVRMAEQESDLKVLASYLTAKPPWVKFPIDQDRRWAIIGQLMEFNHPGAQELWSRESQKDGSDRGQKAALAVRALTPDAAVKKEVFAQISQGPTQEYPLGKIRYLISGLFPSSQERFRKEFGEEFFRNIKVLKDKPHEFLGTYASLAPSGCATESVKKLRDFAEKNSDLPPNVVKSLKISAQESERCIGIRQKIQEAPPIKAL